MDFDVAVIGGGGAGISAALTAAESGARTLLVEAGKKLGGSTALSGGVFYAAGTAIQRANGVEDTAEDMFHHYMTLSRYSVSPALVKKLCDESSPTLDWLISLGVQYTNEGLYVSGCDKVPRGHRPLEAGAELIERLEGALGQFAVDVALTSRVTGLVLDPTGAIGGLRIGDDAVTCRAIVLATGGFGADAQMLAKYFPDSSMGGDDLWYVGAKTCRGDGLRLGVDAGGKIVGHNRGQLNLSAGFSRDNEPSQPGWLVHVNTNGHRFVDESAAYAIVSDQLSEQPGHECYSIFDEAARLSLVRANARQATWEKDLLLRYVEQGRLQQASSLEQLAEKLGLPKEAFLGTIASYNASCDAGTDWDFLKKNTELKPVRTAPFYAARMKPAILGLTSTGLRVDVEARVLNSESQWIPGLFAAGETTGGIISKVYTASGNSVANAIIFGRTAGRGAAAYAASPV